MYIHELQNWPRFHWNQGDLMAVLASVRHRQGQLIGHMEALGFNLRQEAILQTLTGDVLKSSEIEGERLDAGQVRSSIARRLGLDIGALKPADRIGRAIADMALARSENSPQRFYSLSTQIRQERKDYYEILERTQKGTMDITPWMGWFLECLGRAIDSAQSALGSVLAKARFWERARTVALNDRQRLVLNRLLDGFEGTLTTSKYAKLAKCSQDTALRDILPLVESGLLVRNPEGGRSTSYAVAPEPDAP
ncbi:MAG TPA: DUF4172 domain-containing protein [Thermoanaerobaculia bacterium]|jgi:Fic family protein